MSNQVDSKPSTVLIESYNERISKFLLPEDVHNATIVIGEADSDGVAIATITIPGKKIITTKVKRSSIEDTVPLTSIDELGGKKFMRLLMDDPDGIEEAVSDIMGAMGLNSAEDLAALSAEEAAELETSLMFSATLWVKHGIFVPPFDVTVGDISDDYSEYLTQNDNIRGIVEVVAKPTSLAYVGSTKAMLLTQESLPLPNPTYDLDLDKVTNGDTPGQWTLQLDVESDEVPVDSVLTELALTAVNNAYDTTITTADVTSNLEGKTLTIYALKENASNVTGTLIVTVILNVTPPPVVKFDLNTLTNTGSPGTWIHEYDEGADFNAEALIVANQLVEVINLTFDQVVVTSDLAITAEPPDIISISPSIPGRDKLDSMIFVQAKVKPKPIVRFDLSTITNGDEVGVWTLDVNEGDLSEVTAQSATQAVLDVFNASSDIQITYDQLDVVKEDTLITVTPSKGGAGVLEGSFIITLNVIINEVPQSTTGLAADYPGTGWYKATDTGTVFCKGVVENETCIFDEVTYTSVYTAARAKELGSTAAVSNVTDMSSMCGQDSSFNADISSWDVSNVTDMSFMFYDASVFNQDISNWDVSNVTTMSYMFDGARKFNQNLPNWNVSKVTDMSRMFANAALFNGDISTWNTGSVTDMYSTFGGAESFNQDVSSWNVSKVVKMSGTFNYATVFNGDISAWDTSSVTDMSDLFANAPVFNHDISSWNTGNVNKMTYMFTNATAFSQDLSQWCVTNTAVKPDGFDNNSGLTVEQLPVWGTCPRGENAL